MTCFEVAHSPQCRGLWTVKKGGNDRVFRGNTAISGQSYFVMRAHPMYKRLRVMYGLTASGTRTRKRGRHVEQENVEKDGEQEEEQKYGEQKEEEKDDEQKEEEKVDDDSMISEDEALVVLENYAGGEKVEGFGGVYDEC
mmetsp:Transcript_24462/g.52726  ORF Transcript_24462/g.52726 Transcript_24462/m.52726 type:complete len:140 (+) Transcript_24462:350-769(+)